MWDATQQQRLNELQRQAQAGVLPEQEQRALEQLLHALEQEEWNTLNPTLERLRREQKQVHAQGASLKAENTVLAALVERREDLLKRAQEELTSLLSEHEALKIEYQRLTGQLPREFLI